MSRLHQGYNEDIVDTGTTYRDKRMCLGIPVMADRVRVESMTGLITQAQSVHTCTCTHCMNTDKRSSWKYDHTLYVCQLGGGHRRTAKHCTENLDVVL